MIGPSALEQEMIEMINRMRLDPASELPRLINSSDPNVNSAIDFFNVDINVLENQWSSLSAVSPLAWSDTLKDVATGNNNYQVSIDNTAHAPNFGQRLTDAGYSFSNGGENAFAKSQSVFYGHAAFAIDWGFTPTGIQNPPGHRNSIMSSNFRELGIEIRPENNASTAVGPLVMTQNFGNRFALNGKSYLLGVIYDDQTTDDDFYTPGEGLDNVTVTAVDQSNSSNTVTSTNWSSGGYQLLLDPGTYEVTFSGDLDGDGQSDDSYTETVTMSSDNVKLDLATDQLANNITTPDQPQTPEDTDNQTNDQTEDQTPEPNQEDVISGVDLENLSPILIEAEDLELNNYRVESVNGSGASGGEHISLKNRQQSGTASGTFEGEAGTYQVEVYFFDENDGVSSAQITVAGESQSFEFDQDLPSNWTRPASLTSRVTHEAIELEPGDTLEISAQRNRGEYARFDAIKFTPVELNSAQTEPLTGEVLSAQDNSSVELNFSEETSDVLLLNPSSERLLVTDFIEGQDLIQLAGGLTVEQLELVPSGDNTLIQIAQTEQLLATLEGVSASSLDSDDFAIV
ncbi:MAG: CAP domain-containing protein [Cyanobacteria bacterium J06592_8]